MQAIWIEFPAKDVERALRFYETVFGLQSTEIVDDGVRRVATLVNANEAGRPGVSLNQTSNFEPCDHGALAYLAAGEDLSACLARVEPAGGAIVEPKTSMGPAGFYATVRDTEGNVFALYSPK